MSGTPWMADAFRHNGLQVKEVKGWKSAGRPGTYQPKGVVFHHTAFKASGGNAPALGGLIKGVPGVHGPMANVLIGRDGTVFVISAGKANHAGKGGPFRNVPKDAANQFFVGVEVENDGVGEPWSKHLLETCDVVYATLLLGLKRSPSWLIGHKEWAPTRKIDPAPINMDKYRERVAAKIKAMGQKHPKAGTSTETYVVKAGDTLFRIALAHRMSVAELMKANHLTSTLIKVGQKLRVKA